MEAWVFWVLLAVVFAGGEIMTLSFFLAPFAAGALLGAAADLLGAGFAASMLVFLASSGLLFGFVRPIAQRHARVPAHLRTGTAALVGRTATVMERVDSSGGAVKLEGEIWSARAFDGDAVFEPGSRVHVMEIQGATALVSEA